MIDLAQIQQQKDPLTGQTWQALGVQARMEKDTVQLRFPYPVCVQTIQAQLAAHDASINAQVHIDAHAVKEGLKPIPGIKNLIVVGSGKGGVGKSTVSLNVALGLAAKGAKVGLLDADIYGPSVPHLLGQAGRQAKVEDKKLQPVEVAGLPTMSIGYLVDQATPMVWRGPMISSALSQLLYDTQWPELDYLIVDLPPGTGDIQLTLSQKMPVAGAVIVTTPQQVACADAQKALAMFKKVDVPVLGVVENMAFHACPECGHKSYLFGQQGGGALATEQQVPLLGQIPLDAQICARSDAGEPCHTAYPVYQDIAHRLACALAMRPKDYSLRIPKITVTT